MTSTRILAHDCRKAAVHEASHAFVAMGWSQWVVVSLFKNPNYTGSLEQKSVIGQVRFSATASKLGRSALGWAGIIGEMINDEPDWDFDSIFSLIMDMGLSQDDFSATDTAAINATVPKNRCRTARLAYNQLREAWPQLQSIVDDLLVPEFQRTRQARVSWQRGRGWRVLRYLPKSDPARALFS